jgi:AcrR family transcriptional regulator
MPVDEQNASTRGRLLVAAGELLAEQGFARITTRAIAERAEVNNALVHYYFGTKTALLAEAALGLLGDDLSQVMQMLRDAPSVADGVASVVRWIGELDIAEPAVRVLIELTIEAFRNEEVRPFVASALEAGRREMTGALVARGDVEEATAPAVAALLAALLDGVMLHRMIDADLDVSGWAAAAAVFAPRDAARGRRR